MRMGLGLGFGGQRAGTGGAPPTGAILSGLSYASDLISVTTDTASGTIYYLLHNSATPLSGSAIKAAVVGLTAVGGGTLDPLETDNQPVDWTGVTPGTYWINMVQDTGVFSNVVTFEVTIVSAAFDPASLTNVEIFFDIGDMTTLWQNTDGTGAVTASGDRVGSVTNRGSLGGLFVNTGAGVRPTYIEASGRKLLNFDGVDEFLELARGAGSAFTTSGGFYLWVLAYDDGSVQGVGSRAFLSMSAASSAEYNSTNGLGFISKGFSDNTFALRVRGGTDNSAGIQAQLTDSRTNDLPWSIIEFETVPTAASPNAWLRIEQSGDGGSPVSIASMSTSNPGFPDLMTNTKVMLLGATLGTGGARETFHKCSIAAVILASGTVSTTDRDNIRAFLRTRAAF